MATTKPRHDDKLRALVTDRDFGILAGQIYRVFGNTDRGSNVAVRILDPRDTSGGVVEVPLEWFEPVE